MASPQAAWRPTTATQASSEEPRPSWIKNSFYDEVWVHETSEGVERRADFRTVPEQFRLLCKMYLWAIESTSDKRAGQMLVTSARTLKNYFLQARVFFVECEMMGVTRIMDIDPEQFLSIKEARLNRAPMRGRASSKENPATIKFAHSFYHRLYVLGPCVLGVLPDGLAFPPENYRSFGRFSPLIGGTALMPDQVVQQLLLSAIDFLRYGQAIIYCMKVELDVIASLPKHIDLRFDRRDYREAYIALHNLGPQLDGHMRLLQELEPITRSKQTVAPYRLTTADRVYFDIITPRRLEKIRRYLVAACFLVVTGFTGFRASEVLTMLRGDVYQRGSKVIIRTRIRKTSGRPDGAEVERTAPPIVAEAFSLMERLATVIGRGDDRVWLSYHNRNMTVGVAASTGRMFLERVAKLDSWYFSPHQLRRYFATFYMRRFEGSSDALSYHYRHISQRMIESYIRDRAGAAYLLQAKKNLAFTIGEDVVNGYGSYAAKADLPIGLAARRCRAANLPLARIEAEIAKLLAETFRDIRATEYGYCALQEGESEGAVCGARDGIPDAAEVHPGNCAGCRYLVVGRDQLEHWTSARTLHQEVLNSPLTLPRLKQVSRAFIAKATGIIERLDMTEQSA